MTHLRVVSLLGLALAFATPATAQMEAMPVYFSPKGGTGITIDGDFGRVSSAKVNSQSVVNHPTAIGGRVYLGLPVVTLGVGASVYDVKILNQTNSTQYMGTAAIKVLGGPLIPIAVSLQGGAGYLKRGSGTAATKIVNFPIGLGVAINVPTPGASLEPWAALRAQIRSVSTGSGGTGLSQSRVGYGVSGGLNMGLPIGLGLHLGVDWSTYGAKAGSAVPSERLKLESLVVGVGVHFNIRLPGVPMVPGV